MVEAVVAYDRYREEIRRAAERNSAAFQSARLHSERQSAFDELTAMLGEQPSGLEWPSFCSACCWIVSTLVEAIAGWTRRSIEALHEASTSLRCHGKDRTVSAFWFLLRRCAC